MVFERQNGKNHIVESARRSDAPVVARLIMEAMNHECCQWFAGENHTLDDFHRLMTRLVEAESSQYSHRNALVVRTPDGEVAGVAVSYDGALLHDLRRAFILGAQEAFGRDFSQMPDETAAGELYLDSLCVVAPFRGQGMARALLRATIDKGHALGLPTGLLVDKGNPSAECLYQSVGFQWQNDTTWGGHPMRHLVRPLK